MKALKLFLVFVISVVGLACTPQPNAINYGEDKCEYCRMSIVDQRFGGEIVTQKGKVYKFDAAECVVNYLDEHVDDESKLSMILTNTYDQPGKLADATSCFYLISRNMPSPMGMFLNPFQDEMKVNKFHEANGGHIFSWQELRAEFAKYQ